MTKAIWALPAVFVGFQLAAAAQPDVVPRGTEIQVRTNDYINSDHADGRVYTGTVANDVLDRDGRVVIPRGSQAELMARRYNNELSLDLDSINANGRRYVVDARPEEFNGGEKQGVGENKRTGKYVGGGALLGTIVGAIAGGGKGAAIGAAGGAAAGAGAQMATRGRDVRVPAETLITFRLDHGLRVGGPDEGYSRDGYHYHRQQ